MKVSGIIVDAITNEPLPGANVYRSNQVGTPINPIQGTSTDVNGKFEKIIDGSWLTIKYVGYERLTTPVNSNFTIYELRPISYDLPKITVTPKSIFATATFGVLAVLYFLITLKK